MDILQAAKKDLSELSVELKTDLEKGLSQRRAQNRLSKDGRNILDHNDLKWWKIFFKQFNSAFIYLLLAAALLSFVLGQLTEGLMILLFVFINTILGFFQEYRSENTVKLLKKYVKIKARVVRGGHRAMIDSEELVRGDLVVLETGDKIGADLRIIEAYDLHLDESVITGESLAVSKQAELDLQGAKDLDHFSANNICFSGTSVVKGKAKALVIATGKNTFLGNVVKITSQTKKVSNFEKSISKLSSFILKLVLVTLVFVFVFNAVFKDGLDILELIIFSIALAISVVPEALPLVMTFSFSHGAMNLAKKKVVIKRLSSVEDLGNIDILCSDKTGTLTENKLSVIDFYEDFAPAKTSLLYANLASAHLSEKHEPFDIALAEKMDDEDQKKMKKFKFIIDTPFNPERRRNNTLVKGDDLELIVRGAPEAIFPLCINLTNQEKKSCSKWLAEQGLLGRRVLALAKKKLLQKDLEKLKGSLGKEEKDLEFLGMIAFADPVKDSTFQAVVDARDLGVGIKIITGDSAEVAGSVAYQIGLIDSPQKVFLAKDFKSLSEEEKMKVVEEYNVFARVLPEQKFDLIKTLQKKYNVGYLGDGINDAPALKASSVSLAVENSSDIARETADIILLQSDLRVIIDGVKEGRRIFANNNKYIKATLASNFGNFYAVAIASLIVDFLPMLPLQILLLNLLSDFPMIAIATDNVDQEEFLSPKKYQIKDIVMITMMLGALSSVFVLTFFAMFYKISPEVLRTNWFISSILLELTFLFSIRTKKSMFKAKRPSRIIVLLTSVAAFLTVFIPFSAWGQRVFKFVTPQVNHIAIIILITIIYLFSSELAKRYYYRRKNKKLEALA